MNQLLTTGQTAYRQYGPLHIRIDRHDEGVSINVTAHPTLDRTFTNLAEGRAYLRFIRDLALAGTAVWAIEQQAGAWTTAAAIVDQAERDMVQGIGANMQAAQPTPVDVSDIVNQRRGPTFTDLKRNARNDYTRTRVAAKPLTPAELDLIRHHRGGRVTTRPGQSWLVLRAIVRRGYGTAVYGSGHRIVAVDLNERGLAVAEQNGVAAR